MALRCYELSSACLHLNAPQPTCSAQCATRPFRIDVHSALAELEVRSALAGMAGVRDPILSLSFRHLERDVFASPHSPPARPIARGSQFNMLWPAWEAGFGDLHMWTILPLGHAVHEGLLPNGTLGISGALYSRAWHAVSLVRPLCTFERDDVYEVPGARTGRLEPR